MIRTKNAETRANKLSHQDMTNESIDLDSTSASLEDREADLMKRKMWRQARLESMDVASESGDQLIRLVKNVTPIPT